ncbi:zinc finger protein [Anopheles darlingi]|uniref:Zinc finger protein ZPR1 n=1 Tax=Anopheles darlingi TaxID=43151 RepID=W5JVP0_ANODA|nr:zinc finger protein [Anopheles darlingi]
MYSPDDTGFSSEESEDEIAKIFKEKTYHCWDRCGMFFYDKPSFDNHLMDHKMRRRWFCKFCFQGFDKQEELSEHLPSHDGSLLCAICGEIADSPEQNNHDHSKTGPFDCPKCPRRFETQHTFSNHLKRHGAKEFCCEVCGVYLSSRKRLLNHKMAKHSGEKPFSCEVCGHKFALKDRIKSHMKTHTGEKPYGCMFCDRRYGSSGDLKDHLRKHLGENIYQCDQCDASPFRNPCPTCAPTGPTNMETITEQSAVFPKLNVDEEPELGATEIESMCMSCQENGITRLLLTQIPFYKEVVIMSFSCEHCGYENNEIQPGGEIAQKGIKICTQITTARDLNRRVIKSDFSCVRIEQLDFEIPAQSQKGEVTTVEGIIDRVVRGLEQDQPVRRIQHPEAASQIDDFISNLQSLKELKEPFTLTISDISGNSFVENPNAPQPDPATTITHFQRTKEENHLLGIFTHDEVADKPAVAGGDSKLEPVPEEVDSLLKPIREGAWTLEELQGEVLQFKTQCPECSSDCDTNMKVTTIPHFKEVVIMATVCDNCGLRTNEVKPGGGIEEQGVKIEVTVRGRIDFARDVLKSESCSLHIRELECEVGAGALGGRFTTIEGLLTAMREQLVESTGMFMDSNDAETRDRMDTFFGHLDTAIAGNKQLTIVLDDPTGNSYVQSLSDDGTPDEALRIIRYHRSFEQNEELGLNDMKTENYGEEALTEEHAGKGDS